MRIGWLFLMLVVSAWAWSEQQEVREFVNLDQQARYQQLINEIRCPKCQNQSIADSNAGISEDLRDLIYEKIMAGESDEAIVAFLTERYGDFISYKPSMRGANLILWFGPFLFIALVLLVIFARTRKATNVELSVEDEERLQKLLSEEEK
ncbi:cytochrome c-type biogenesis protein [Pleionea sp. CnH1-48]|uniref:cytochrome c-type biogenesis protein n=1 Tax=Pleionea sp. CnH1-48 TaxID=2954494 RepID=UPI002096928E|nr:cytochrome c-type biogenesis protein [Pleionea sp. CnH1-48]MCO7223612.1 cytochrome c-type biogenesis protein CcmH [Pleionea sp. CnH1-48]